MNNNHGQMKWTGKLDIEHYALFECAECGRVVGLRPGAMPKTITQGNLYAIHQAWIMPNMAGLWELEVPEGLELADLSVSVTNVQVAESDGGTTVL